MTDDFVKVSEHIHETIREFGRAVSSMRVDDEPSYDVLQNVMTDLADHCPLHAPYDWENEYADVLAESDINQALFPECA